MRGLYKLAAPILMRMDAENAHHLALRAMEAGFYPRAPQGLDDPSLHVDLWGLHFANPVGLAAGFDKDARVIAPCLRMGFGFVEAGTVTPEPQAGNPRPRIFRDMKARAIINRMGFPSRGAVSFRHNMEAFLSDPRRPAGLVGINIGMNKGQDDPAQDYVRLVKELGGLADYITVNISSPNTPGLRDLQKRDAFMTLVERIIAARGGAKAPLLVKLAPDLDEGAQEMLASCALEAGIDGLILTNTTLERPEGLPPALAAQAGGLSGAPLTEKGLAIIRNFYHLTGGRIPLIAAGGICDGSEAYARIRAGAGLIQLYSALVFRGPDVVWDIRKTLAARLRADGFTHISEAVGADHR